MTQRTESSGLRIGRGRVTREEWYVTQFLDDLAPGFDEWEGGLHRRLADRVVAMAAPQPGDDCLDLGAGTGLIAELIGPLVGAGGSVVSVDVSRRMLDVARARTAPNARVISLPIDDLFFRDGSFDLATVGRSLAWIVDPRAALLEARRILRGGGHLVAFCRRRSLSTPAERVFLAELGRLAPGHPIRLPQHYPEQSDLGERPALGRLLDECGFAVERFSEMITGGHASGAREWNELMMQSWPAARLLVGGLGPAARGRFEAALDAEMSALGEDAYRYHHPYLFARATTAP